MPRTKLIPAGKKLTPGTPVKITHSDCKNHKIHETSVVEEDGISTRSHLDPKTLKDMKISQWSICVTTPTPIQYQSTVAATDIRAGYSICLCNKNSISGSQVYYARTMNYRNTKRFQNPPKHSKIKVQKALEEFLKSEISKIPSWYTLDSHSPNIQDCKKLVDFIIPPEENMASTTLASNPSILARAIVETSSSTDHTSPSNTTK